MSCDDWLHVENDAPGGTFLWKTCGYCGELRIDPCFPHIECGKLSFPFHGHTVAGLRRLQQPVQHAVRLPDAIDPSGSSRPGSIRVLHAAHQHQAHLGPCHGHIEHTSNGKLSVANYSCRDQGLIDGLLADLGAAGIRAAAVDYAKARWMKAMWNMPFNGPCSVLGQTTDRMLASPSGERLVRALLAEVIGAARACGAVGIDESVGERMIEMTRNMPPYSPSMKVDCDLGRPMEIEYLYTKPIAMAREAGYAMPHMEMVEMQLRAIEELRAVGPAVGQ
mgnify:CR=1 FL=1